MNNLSKITEIKSCKEEPVLFKKNPTAEGSDKITEFFLRQKAHGKTTALLFAMGGGNDTFSAIHIAKYLLSLDFDVTVYGILGFTPFHYVSEELADVEEPIIEPTKNFKRSLMMKSMKRIRNTEHLIPEILTTLGLEEIKVKLLSSKYSPKFLSEQIQVDLSQKEIKKEDVLAIGVDFGGDVITRGEPTTISPGLDATTLQVIARLQYDKTAMICWSGVDGELSPKDMKYNMVQLNPIASSEVDGKSECIQTLRKIYDFLKDVRPGNTIPLALSLFKDQNDHTIVNDTITKSHQANKKKVVSKFQVQIDLSIARKVYLVGIENLQKSNPYSKLEYQDLLEYFIKIMDTYDSFKFQNPNYQLSAPYLEQKGSDFLMQFLRLDENGFWTSRNSKETKVMQILITPESYSKTDKQELITEGLNYLCDGKTDIALILQSQFYEAELSLKGFPIKSYSAGKYLIVTTENSNDYALAKETCQKIETYTRQI